MPIQSQYSLLSYAYPHPLFWSGSNCTYFTRSNPTVITTTASELFDVIAALGIQIVRRPDVT
jgi:hypothetical protein